MLGGEGWTRNLVENFLGKNVYTIPCGSVRKGDDPHGRIVHDCYGLKTASRLIRRYLKILYSILLSEKGFRL